jgi:hypothetical protein
MLEEPTNADNVSSISSAGCECPSDGPVQTDHCARLPAPGRGQEFVFADGDPITHVFRVETGAVALSKILADPNAPVVLAPRGLLRKAGEGTGPEIW